MQTGDLIKRLDAVFEMRERGDHSGSLRELEKLEKSSWHPKDIAVLRLFQATCLTDMGRPKNALERLSTVDKAELTFPKRIDFEYERARIERALGNTNKAIGITENALKTASAAVDKDELRIVAEGLRTLWGILLAEGDRCDEAIPVLETVPMDDKGWAEAKLLLGDCSYKRRRYHEAIHYYLAIISAVNISTVIRNDAVRNLGCAYHQLGDYAKAVEYLIQVKNAYDEFPSLKSDLYRFLASGYSHLGMAQEAAKYVGLSKGTKLIQ
jgi:tetratricopeptide (TPR) repeat protein